MGETLLMRQTGEPSVEEILESIKKVIARDSREEAARVRSGREEVARARDQRVEAAQQSPQRAQRQRASAAVPASAVLHPVVREAARAQPADDDAILELTDFDDSDLDEFGLHGSSPDLAMAHDEPSNLSGDPMMDEDATKPLVADTAVASMRDSLAALALLSQPGAAPQIVRSGETSLEGLTRELLRPMLAEWLEKNLPAMVERLVATEIARIVRKQG